MQCLNISDFIIDDRTVEYVEEFSLSLSVVQTSFPVEQLTFYRSMTQIFIVDDDIAGNKCNVYQCSMVAQNPATHQNIIIIAKKKYLKC